MNEDEPVQYPVKRHFFDGMASAFPVTGAGVSRFHIAYLIFYKSE
ncbi:MAG: hypothetical protein RBT11_01835 [Desulfobacterales bacterium]|nr:hypothetical protein [Desulfobacterales bacterium]